MSFPRYPAYKPSGVAWLGEVPEHWFIDRMKWAIEQPRNGIWGNEECGDDNDIPCVRVADFDRQRLRVLLNEPTIRNVTPKEREGRVLLNNDLLIEKSGGGELQPVGCVVIYADNEPAICSNFVAKASAKPGMSPSYWCYLHSAAYSARINTRSIKQTSGIQNLDQSQYLDEPACYPPHIEQEAIARFLDRETAKIDALIAEQQRLIELIQEKRQAVISHAVTKGLNPNAPMKDSGVEWLGEVQEHWEVMQLNKLIEKITNGYVGPTRDILVDEGVRYLQSLHIKNNRIIFETPYYVSKEWSLSKEKSILHAGDVLIVQTGDIGQSAVVTDEFEGCNCHALIVVSPRQNLLSGEWLSWVLNSAFGRETLLSIQTGALHPHLNCGNVKYIHVPVPPKDEQEAICRVIQAKIEEFDCLISAASCSINLMLERRSALISAAVTGQIDVRGLVTEEAA